VALGPLTRKRAALVGWLLLAGPAACEGRNVFLVPPGVAAGAGGDVTVLPSDDAGHKPALHVDSGKRTTPDGSPETDSGSSPDASPVACETTPRNHQIPQPLGVYVLVDQSYAMLTQWDSVSAALKTFIGGGDELGGVSIGIQYYALSPVAFSPDPYLTTVCKWESYVKPDVDILPLPMNQMPLFDSLAIHGPTSLKQFLDKLGLTLTFAATESPIDAAIQGAVQGARNWATMNAASQPAAAVLLVTNAIANDMQSPTCVPSTEKAKAAAAIGLTSNPPISTYVLAVGGPNADLNAVAASGGTGSAYPVTDGVNVLDALLKIRQDVLPCNVTVNMSEEEELRQGKLNVELNFQLSDPNRPPSRYGRVKSATDCTQTPSTGEWYAEGSGADTKVRLCPSTCDAARSVPKARLDVVHGCPTTYVVQ
jgi:hypothetical protein